MTGVARRPDLETAAADHIHLEQNIKKISMHLTFCVHHFCIKINLETTSHKNKESEEKCRVLCKIKVTQHAA